MHAVLGRRTRRGRLILKYTKALNVLEHKSLFL